MGNQGPWENLQLLAAVRCGVIASSPMGPGCPHGDESMGKAHPQADSKHVAS